MKNKGLLRFALAAIYVLVLGTRVMAQGPPPPPPPPLSEPEIFTPKKQDSLYKASFFSRMQFPVQAKLTAKHIRLPGTRIFTLPFALFNRNGVMFCYKDDPKFFFMLGEKDISRAKTQDSITQLIESLVEGPYMKTAVRINGNDGIYMESLQSNGTSSVFMAWGNDSISFYYIVHCDMTNEMMVAEYKNIMESFYYKANYPLEIMDGIDIRFDLTITGFKPAKKMAGIPVFTPTGNFDESKDVLATQFQIVQLPVMKLTNTLAYCENIHQLSEMIGFTYSIKDYDTRTINDHFMQLCEYELVKEGKAPVRFFQAIILFKNMSVMLVAISEHDHAAYKDKWMKTLASIKPKN